MKKYYLFWEQNMIPEVQALQIRKLLIVLPGCPSIWESLPSSQPLALYHGDVLGLTETALHHQGPTSPPVKKLVIWQLLLQRLHKHSNITILQKYNAVGKIWKYLGIHWVLRSIHEVTEHINSLQIGLYFCYLLFITIWNY